MNGLAHYLAEFCRLYVLVILVVAAAGKLKDLPAFKTATANLLRLSPPSANLAAYAALFAEIAIAAMLMAGGIYVRWAMGSAALLFMAFTAVIAAALARRQVVRCNCFGARGDKITGHDVVRNGLLIAAALYFVAFPTSAPLLPVETILLLGIAGIAFLITTSLRDIARVLRPEPS